MKNPKVTVHVDTRDKGIEGVKVARASIQGVVREAAKGSAEWDQLKAIFLKKTPGKSPSLAMMTCA